MSHATAFLHHSPNRRFWVIPYVRGRLVFAQAAASTLQDRTFDTVLADLPCFMNENRWLDAPLASFPLVSSLLVKGDDETCSLYPLVPTDAACAAAWLARKRTLAFECVDPVIPVRPRSDVPQIPAPLPGDEQLVSIQGPKAYFETAWAALDELRQTMPDARMRRLLARGAAVATRISDRLSPGREVLVVCEYRTWWAVRKALEAPPRSRATAMRRGAAQRARSCALLLEDPFLLWAAGLFDDFPAVNREFYASLDTGSASAFDKLAVLKGLVGGCSTPGDRDSGLDLSAKALSDLLRELRNQPGSKDAGSLVPVRFFECARSRLGPEAADALASSLLDYPMPTAADAGRNPPEFFEVSGESALPRTKGFSLPDVFHVRPYGESRNAETDGSPAGRSLARLSWLLAAHPVITRQEAKGLGERTSDSRWAVRWDYEVHHDACALIREAAARMNSSDFEGEELDEHTPVVFVFCKEPGEPRKLVLVCDNNLARSEAELRGPEAIPRGGKAPDLVYSVFATSRALESVFEAHVERELITSLALLYSGSGMGLERHAAITRQPTKYQCRLRPQDDCALGAFKSVELGLAWAIRYAKKSVLTVACPGWEPSPGVQEFASRNRKRILHLSLDVLPGEMARRLTRLHFISNALKVHPECDGIVSRFVR